jgi:ribonuclease HI
MTKKYYAYFFSENKKGICESWVECEKIVKGKDARYRSFKTRGEAERWLDAGAEYEKRLPAQLETGIYFDAGTGRGNGVEISVTDERGTDLLGYVLAKKLINRHGKHKVRGRAVTNNYGELLACKYALQLALKRGAKKIFGDSRLVVDFWSLGIVKRKELPERTVRLADEVVKLRREFEMNDGAVIHISGDDNPADLGFHK